MARSSRAPRGAQAPAPVLGAKGRGARTPSSSRRIEATFGFIDLAGFTALTEAHGDYDAADIATATTNPAANGFIVSASPASRCFAFPG